MYARLIYCSYQRDSMTQSGETASLALDIPLHDYIPTSTNSLISPHILPSSSILQHPHSSFSTSHVPPHNVPTCK